MATCVHAGVCMKGDHVSTFVGMSILSVYFIGILLVCELKFYVERVWIVAMLLSRVKEYCHNESFNCCCCCCCCFNCLCAKLCGTLFTISTFNYITCILYIAFGKKAWIFQINSLQQIKVAHMVVLMKGHPQVLT